MLNPNLKLKFTLLFRGGSKTRILRRTQKSSPGVSIYKFDMLNPNLKLKITLLFRERLKTRNSEALRNSEVDF